MPIKYKSMSIIRLNPSSQQSLSSLFGDIFYRDKTGSLASSALRLYNKIRQGEGMRSSEWQNYISAIFKVNPVDFAESTVINEVCKKHGLTERLRGKKPYRVLIEKHLNGKIKLEEKELALLQRVSKWHSAVSSYYSIINKLKAIGMIEKKEGSYVQSNRFLNSLKAIEKSLQESK